MKSSPLTEIDVHSWNRFVDAQKVKFPERALHWEMQRLSIERVRELERISEAREIVAARREGTTGSTGTSQGQAVARIHR